uniref:Uncharacterized protein n=1 Tax=Leptobrachium leishanense TaxID=445787 RepID=A0A8C5Q0C9_9ANUR
MATSKEGKKAAKSEFFTPRATKLKESVASQDGGGSSPASPSAMETGSAATPANPNLEALMSRMADMLGDLSATLTARLDAVATAIRSDIKEIGERTDRLETKMSEFADAHNTMAEQVETLEEKLKVTLLKLADMEDRSRRYNLKIRGIPDSVTSSQLTSYMTDLFQSLLPDATPDLLLFDRIHRLPKPPSAPVKAPRDVLLRLHYFKPREDILRALRDPGALQPEYDHISVYPDLSKATLQQRRDFKHITAILRNNNTGYRWGFPTKLLISRNGTIHVAVSVEEGDKLLRDWGFGDHPPQPRSQTAPRRLDPEWHKR